MPQREGSGRKRDLAWDSVTVLTAEKDKVACNYYGLIISMKIERVKNHLGKIPHNYHLSYCLQY